MAVTITWELSNTHGAMLFDCIRLENGLTDEEVAEWTLQQKTSYVKEKIAEEMKQRVKARRVDDARTLAKETAEADEANNITIS